MDNGEQQNHLLLGASKNNTLSNLATLLMLKIQDPRAEVIGTRPIVINCSRDVEPLSTVSERRARGIIWDAVLFRY